ncbi:MAG: hypothetical protein LBB08_00305 [Rickettsiales bacterium]|jgi:guanylate kinase|nr:hypothetical protein [Rickettsiales bacterium]
MNKSFLFLTGMSGTGKSWFWQNVVGPAGKFRKIVSATTRGPRSGEQEGVDYYFRNEAFFDSSEFAVKLFVNEAFWKEGEPKWLYGIEEAEIDRLRGENLTYDCIEPKYVRAVMDWCGAHGRKYDFKIAYFLNSPEDTSVVQSRANMRNDMLIRSRNTCSPRDFLRAGIHPDWFMLSSAKDSLFDRRFADWLARVE